MKRLYTLYQDVQLSISCRCQIRCLSVLYTKGRRAFLFLAYSGVVYAAGCKNKAKKHIEHERVHFWGTTEHERGPYTHTLSGKKHTEHERCGFGYH